VNLSPSVSVHVGREARLPLTITAEGLGPHLHLSYDLFDMRNVVVGDGVFYEVRKVEAK